MAPFNRSYATYYWPAILGCILYHFRLRPIWRRRSVSETIRKEPITEVQTALGKQKIRSVDCGICPITEMLLKTASSQKISLKSGNQLLSYCPKIFVKWWPFALLNLWFSDCHRVASVQSCTQFYHNRNRMTFRWDMAILWFAVGLWRQFAILNFWNLEFMS